MSQVLLRNCQEWRPTVGDNSTKLRSFFSFSLSSSLYLEELSFRSSWIQSVILILSLQQLTVINTKERHYILNAEKHTLRLFSQINTAIILLRNGIVYQSGQNCQSKRRENRQIKDGIAVFYFFFARVYALVPRGFAARSHAMTLYSRIARVLLSERKIKDCSQSMKRYNSFLRTLIFILYIVIMGLQSTFWFNLRLGGFFFSFGVFFPTSARKRAPDCRLILVVTCAFWV